MRFLLFILPLLLSQMLFAQSANLSLLWKNDLDIAHDFYQKRLFADAVTYYQKAMNQRQFGDLEYRRMADSYRILKKPKIANTYYSLFINDSKENSAEDLFNYAETLLNVGQVEEAIGVYERYYYLNAHDERVNNRIESLFNLDEIYKDSLAYSILLTEVNSPRSEMSCQIYNDGLVFTSVAGSSLVIHDAYRNADLPQYQLYYANFDSLYVKYPINSKGGVINISHPAISEDGSMIVTGNKWRGVSIRKDTVNNLQLFESVLRDSLKWSGLKPVNFCDEQYSYTSPWVSSGYDTLLFASNLPGGIGGFDLYISLYDGEVWSDPLNLGPEVNSQGDEFYPYMLDNSLYFASNGLGGLGGLDIFKADIQGLKFNTPANMGYPLNSHMDDFAIVFSTTSQGFFTSNRERGAGSDDIYSFTYEPIQYYDITLSVLDSSNNKGLNNAVAEVYNKTTQKHHILTLDAHGQVTFEMSEHDRIDLHVFDEGYYDKFLAIDNPDEDQHLEVSLELKPVFERIELSNIIYAFDEFNLKEEHVEALDSLVPTLKRYEYLKVDVESHTDSRGGEDYNIELSEKRAQSISQYLVDKGIDRNRISMFGYGESQPVVDCSEENPCSDEEHEQNRRTILVVYTDRDQ